MGTLGTRDPPAPVRWPTVGVSRSHTPGALALHLPSYDSIHDLQAGARASSGWPVGTLQS